MNVNQASLVWIDGGLQVRATFPAACSRRDGGRTAAGAKSFEHSLAACILSAVSWLTKAVALTVLTLWGLAAVHCKLEALPGLEFLKRCCFADSATSSQQDCESDGCGTVEKGAYRAEERTASVPQPLLILALLAPEIETPMPRVRAGSFAESHAPPELPKAWQFLHRTALLPRAPSIAS
jgi:hypothetical protein